MPARKPLSLTTKNLTSNERTAKQTAQNAVTPLSRLGLKPPPQLRADKVASSVWTEILTLQDETQAAADGEPIITAFDKGALIAYCMVISEETWLNDLRADVEEKTNTLSKQIAKGKPKGDDPRAYYSLMEQYNALVARLIGIDARLDGKRKLEHTLAQSLYLTPRARAGVAPADRKPPEPANEMAALLEE